MMNNEKFKEYYFTNFSDSFQSVLTIVVCVILVAFLLLNLYLLVVYCQTEKIKEGYKGLFEETKVSASGLTFNLA